MRAAEPRRRRAGQPTAEDRRLWAEVARTITPLPGRAAPEPGDDAGTDRGAPVAATPVAAERPEATPARKRGAVAPAGPPLEAPDRRMMRRMRGGSAPTGPVLDLHGLRQEEARLRLMAFLRRCQSEGAKSAMVITGKGGSEADGLLGGRGALRRAVPLWLSLPDWRAFVLGFGEAGTGLGGAGALVVRIRSHRRRP